MPSNPSQPPAAPVQRRIVVGALLAFWTSFIALYSLRSFLLGFQHQDAAFVRRAMVALVGIALSWLMYRVLERWRSASLRATIALIAAMSVAAALVFALASYLVFGIIAPMPDDMTPSALSTVSDLWINWTFVFAAWGLLYLSLASAAATRAADLRAGAHREAARIAEIRALRYQINPHFLFNLLNALTALVGQRNTSEAEAVIAEMGRFFRYTLSTNPLDDAVLADEVDMQARYLELERRRFPERMVVHIDVAAAVAQALVPSLILQPVIENAVKHGLARTAAQVRIAISAGEAGPGRLRIVVEDDAQPGSDGAREPAPHHGLGIGLKNVAERLVLHFGASASCVASPLATGGFRVELSMPLVTA